MPLAGGAGHTFHQPRDTTPPPFGGPFAAAGDHRCSTHAPVLGTVDMARSQETALQVAILIEHEQRLIAHVQPK
jgi:hypothetical protein